MKAILDVMAPEYAGRVNIVIIDVYAYMDLVRQYRITVIPTQIFFDNAGNAVTKHTGLLPKDGILDQFNKMGIE
jgi:thioredoxin 1